jgi:hypothetical protein
MLPVSFVKIPLITFPYRLPQNGAGAPRLLFAGMLLVSAFVCGKGGVCETRPHHTFTSMTKGRRHFTV